ncbi:MULTISPECIES: beta-ketoacyl synthase N-terminal-like domain-containing protein [unclassified Paenibacillus]|uniref:beta-ketoacyl synthase N-terminal-like domain-containing protein n=1 Tax=unclassified Paenibacillus TaxID=185978 RepID=UPI0036D2AAD5
MKIVGSKIVTFQGFGLDGLFDHPQEKNGSVIRPVELKGSAPRIDCATGLTASAAVQLKKAVADEYDSERIGIVIGTRNGNYQIAKEYADRIRSGAASPALFSTSGFNICAGLAALAAKVSGPSLALVGTGSSWADCLTVASHYILRHDADLMLVGQVEITDDGQAGLCGMIALSKASLPHSGDAFVKFTIGGDAALQETGEMEKAASPALPDSFRILEDCITTCLWADKEVGVSFPFYLKYEDHFSQHIEIYRS